MGNRRYDDEFKKEAVRMVIDEERSIRSVEKALGITFGVLKAWVAAHRQKQENKISKHQIPPDVRIRQLEKQLAQTTRERDILKKAVAIFSKEPNPYSGS